MTEYQSILTVIVFFEIQLPFFDFLVIFKYS